MKEFLKGNYKVDTEIKETAGEERSQLEAEFERKALSRLGGSICFVSKKAFIWTGESEQGEAQDGAGKEDRPVA
ncbi:MAG TPA: hypothetical protein VJX71_18565 [Methylomirabilota bacterium]|nr:hypothetical protein [Methylomirabilota bacterium]